MNERYVRRSESFMGISALLKKKVSEGSISSEKLGRGLSDTLFNVDSETLSGNRIFDIEILMSIFSILSCPVCYNQELYLIEDSRLGLQSNYVSSAHLKSLLYETPVTTAEDFTARTVVASAGIASTLDLFERIRQSFVCRRLYYDLRRQSFEQFL
ncbi:hypothetical protein TNCV_1085551 [Trichonephila clavipes]|nr:hypothetical protein TNCV_1085551 [Trichonephila clavipes]